MFIISPYTTPDIRTVFDYLSHSCIKNIDFLN